VEAAAGAVDVILRDGGTLRLRPRVGTYTDALGEVVA
jgi:hypothetical protein